MIYLPAIRLGVIRCRLPLSGSGAEASARALLWDDQGARTAAWAEVLREEPGLVLWAIIRAGGWQLEAPRGVTEIAGWLVEHASHALRWSHEELPPADSCHRVRGGLTPTLLEAPAVADVGLGDPDPCRRWSELAAAAVADAWGAARAAEEDWDGSAYLRGLLSRAGQWLGSSDEASCTGSGEGWPRWLNTAEPLLSGCSAIEPPELSAAAEGAARIRQRWRDGTSGWDRQLPALADRLRRLAELEQEFQAAVEREKLAALKELAYGASHEINNPLANISTRAQTLMREEPDPERRRKLAVINAQAFRAHEMIADMMLFARPPALERQAVDLTALANRVIRELQEDAAAQGTLLERVSADQPLTISADPAQLGVALKALCTNALEALRSGGQVEVAIRPGEAAEPRLVEILVSDNGPGISPEVRRHLFDPYFSGREAGRGLGLGLAKCWRIVTEHGGRIDVRSVPHRETTFTIQLPASAAG